MFPYHKVFNHLSKQTSMILLDTTCAYINMEKASAVVNIWGYNLRLTPMKSKVQVDILTNSCVNEQTFYIDGKYHTHTRTIDNKSSGYTAFPDGSVDFYVNGNRGINMNLSKYAIFKRIECGQQQ